MDRGLVGQIEAERRKMGGRAVLFRRAAAALVCWIAARKSFPASVSEGFGFRVCPGLADLIAASSENWGWAQADTNIREIARQGQLRGDFSEFLCRETRSGRPAWIVLGEVLSDASELSL